MASISPYKNQWRAQVYVLGTRDSKVLRTKREAETWAAAREVELRKQGSLTPSQRYTVADVLTRYRDEISSKKRSAHAEGLAIEAFVRDFPRIAAMSLEEVDSSSLSQWRDIRLAGYDRVDGKRVEAITQSSFLREMSWLNNAFSIARKEWKWMAHNPFEGMRRPAPNAPRDRRVTPKEVKLICRRLGYVTGKEPTSKNQEVALIFLVALRTAMRAGEIRSLGAKTLDIKRRVATVTHKMQYKTGKPRQVPLSKHAIRLLRPVAHREQCFSVKADVLATLFRRACSYLLIKDLHFHDTRAEALTRFSKKVDVMTLAKISGHQDLGILQNVYYRESAEDIAARL